MSFACRPPNNGGGSPVINPIPVSSLGDYKLSPTNASCGVTFNANGTLTSSGNSSSTGPNWYLPTTTSIGNGYWIRIQVTSGTSPTSGDTVNVWHPLSSARFWTWLRTVIGTTSAVVRFDIATDSGGTNIVASVTGVSVDSTVDV